MADMGAESISDARLKRAAEARFYEGLPWNLCAECADISERHLRRLRSARDERWLEVVVEVQEALEDEALPTAIGTLVRMAAQNDVAAAKALLDKWKATKLEHSGPGGGAVQVSCDGGDAVERLASILAQRDDARTEDRDTD